MRTPARRETNRHHVTAGCKHGRWVSAAMIVAGLLGNLKVFGQFIDRGAVDMSCDEECYCEGDSEDGTITVFDIPSSGQRVGGVLSVQFQAHISRLPSLAWPVQTRR